MSTKAIVIGAGAAGMIAAIRAAEAGLSVVVLEKTERPGLKILISGGGKCNLTHTGTVESVRSAFRANEARFLKPAFYRYFSEDFLSILHRAGIATYARPDGRIFPVGPCDAKDVVSVLARAVSAAGASITTRSAVIGLAIDRGKVIGVRVAGRVLEADRVIVAAGGSSYPATGTTGDAWRWAADAGHTIVSLRAALAPLYLASAVPDWSGVALRDVVLRARVRPDGKEYSRWRGDLLFTHRGVSGPAALGISRAVADRMADGLAGGGVVEVDLLPDLGFEELQAQVRREISASPRRTIGGFVETYLPKRLAERFARDASVHPPMRCANLPSTARNRLVARMKGWPLGAVAAVPLERGEVVAGGVSLDEVDPQTMESKMVSGLYLCGEVLDIAGPVGGYNLQAAWSTGWVAGDSAAKLRPSERR